MCSFVSVDQKVSLLNKRSHMYLYRARKLIYSKETPKSMLRDTVSLETQVGHRCTIEIGKNSKRFSQSMFRRQNYVASSKVFH